MRQFAEIKALQAAAGGEMQLLADLVREGFPLSERGREFVAEFLETAKPKRGRGAPRVYRKMQRDAQIALSYATHRKVTRASHTDAVAAVAERFHLSDDHVEAIVKEADKIADKIAGNK